MKSINQIFSYLELGMIDEFLLEASKLEINEWNNINNLKLLINNLEINNSGLRDFIYRIVQNISDLYKPLAANLIVNYLFKTDKEIRNLASDLLIKIGKFSNNSLLQLLTVDDVDVKKFASDILGFTGTDVEIFDLIELLKDGDMNVFTSAIESIGSIFERHKEKDGLSNSMLELFIKIYESDNQDTKPVIIEAISKIGNENACDFLMNLLNTESDIFTITIIIDTLAISANSAYLCEKLYNEIGTYPKAIQPIILKTLVAVALRVDYEIIDNPTIRSIAHISLKDNDPDIRTAGLLALGSYYYEDEIRFLVNEFIENSDDLKYYILSILFTNENISLFENFINELSLYNASPEYSYSIIDILGYIHNLSNELESHILHQIFKTIICINCGTNTFEDLEVIDSLNTINSEILQEVIREIINDNIDKAEINKLQDYLNNNSELH